MTAVCGALQWATTVSYRNENSFSQEQADLIYLWLLGLHLNHTHFPGRPASNDLSMKSVSGLVLSPKWEPLRRVKPLLDLLYSQL